MQNEKIQPIKTFSNCAKSNKVINNEIIIIDQSTFKAKTRAENALNYINDAVICTDIDCNIDDLNCDAERITGWSLEDDYGKPINQVFNIIHISTRKRAFSPFGLLLQTNKPRTLSTDILLIKRDGTQVPIEDSTSPIHNLDGKLTGVVIVFHDFSAEIAKSKKMVHLASTNAGYRE